MVDAGYLREHYDKLTDEELERIAKSDLVSEARDPDPWAIPHRDGVNE